LPDLKPREIFESIAKQCFQKSISTPPSKHQQQIERLIGESGSVIDSLQYLATTSLNKNVFSESIEPIAFYTVELDDYRAKRSAILRNIANDAVKSVRETGEEFLVKHLSSSDRRYIHEILEDIADIETVSQGREPNRQLVIKLVQP